MLRHFRKMVRVGLLAWSGCGGSQPEPPVATGPEPTAPQQTEPPALQGDIPLQFSHPSSTGG